MKEPEIKVKELFTWGELREFFMEQREAARTMMERVETPRQFGVLQGRTQVWSALLNLPQTLAMREAQRELPKK